MIGAGLSLEQAPPASVPMRFFLTAPILGIAAALLLVLDPSLPSSRWTPGMLAATHLFLVGFVVMVMLGALHQLLPVAAGAPLRAVGVTGAIVHVAFTQGTVALAAGLAMGSRIAALAGAALLVAGAATFLGASSRLWARRSGGDTSRGIALALPGFAIAVALGATLAAGHGGLVGLRRFPLTDVHAAWALLGWVGALVMGVSWQLVPMLFTAPPHPRLMRLSLVPALLLLLAARSFGTGIPALVLDVAMAGLLAAFGAVTLLRLSQRRRSVPDASVSLLRFAMISLLAAVLAWAALKAWPGAAVAPGAELVPALIFAVAFASSVVVAMLLKIVPFLAWFHLQARAGRRIAEGLPAPAVPTMKEVLPDSRARLVALLHAAASAAIVAAPLLPSHAAWAIRGAGLLLVASFATLGLTLARAAWRLRSGRVGA